MDIHFPMFEKPFGKDFTHPGTFNGQWVIGGKPDYLESISPIDGNLIGRVSLTTEMEYEETIQKAREAFLVWRKIPAPKRGEIVRQMGLRFREYKESLGKLITLEMGKILPEGEGEVQELIDIADFAVGLSRQLYGMTTHSERPHHRLYEQWHPLGPVGVITAFNFPVAVFGWNAMIALICGDTLVWKPSSKTPLSAVAVVRVMEEVLRENEMPEGVVNLVIGSGATVGELLIKDTRVPLISATGSVPMGRHVGKTVAERLGKTILELGGNNGVILMEDTDMELALQAVLFGAVGTAGQRCTTIRRLMVHEAILEAFTDRLVGAYKSIQVGDPFGKRTLMGPLIDADAVRQFEAAVQRIKEEGGKILTGGEVLKSGDYAKGFYVEPTLVMAHPDMSVIKQETFAPILYILPFKTLEEAIELHNAVPQGLSSAMFTKNLLHAETFLGPEGSDCGIANINIGTSGAEIGGAFGGEKETGGGREAGSDAWKAYMRRQTCTINWGQDMPLAQGIQFGSGCTT